MAGARHILILAAGSAGDVYPFIVIGQALLRRGYDVTLVASDNFKERVERAGMAFASGLSQAELDELVHDPDLWHPQKGLFTIWKHMARHFAPSYARQLALVEARPTVIVASTLAMTGRILQEARGVPLATVHLAPACFFSAYDPAARAGLEWLAGMPPWVVRIVLGLIDRLLIDPAVRPGVNDLRASLGLAPARRILSWWLHSPQRVICAFPDWFAAPQADWPPNTVCTGFPRMPAAPDDALGEELRRFLDAGPAPIAVTPGSAMAHGRAFIERAIAAAAALQQRVVVITPFREQLPPVLPAFVHHVTYAPFDALAPRVAVFVHHGGVGTSATVMAAGKPQLVVPFSYDQPDNGMRLTRLGVGAMVKPDAPLDAWTAALSGLLNRPEVATACAALAAKLASERPPAEQIADLIESLAAK
ncbi:glycosyltransferase [Oxalobacteraceae bacterium OTU3CAMAD1]|nr:glycosyltransferase [Oxalobacteraceae bacterium OTU3CAMAD1]